MEFEHDTLRRFFHKSILETKNARVMFNLPILERITGEIDVGFLLSCFGARSGFLFDILLWCFQLNFVIMLKNMNLNTSFCKFNPFFKNKSAESVLILFILYGNV